MKESWSEAIALLFQVEGFDADIHGDPGGKTRFGISEKWFPHDYALVANMGEADAKAYAEEFYERAFWTPMGCDTFAHPLDIMVFDAAVNQGKAAAQACLYFTHNWRDYLLCRIQKYAETKNEELFLKGWDDRILTLWNKYRLVA